MTKENEALKQRIKRLEREVELLRLYGNKDCTAMADEALAKEAKL
jgi:cell division protein FtsB